MNNNNNDNYNQNNNYNYNDANGANNNYQYNANGNNGGYNNQMYGGQNGGYNNFNNNMYGGMGNAPTLAQYTAKTFLYMFLGLLLTFVTAFAVSNTSLIYVLYSNIAVPFILLIVEVALVFVLSSRITKLSVSTSYAIFFIYSFVNGITFASIFIMYNYGTLILVFGMAALYFGAMALYGYVTKRDLSRLGPILFGGVIVLAIFWLLSMFLNLSGLETIMCIVGIAIFMGLTAYDMQKIKAFHAAYGNDPAMSKKMSIMGALQLYLDFINIFLYLLRIVGRGRN